MSQYMNSQAIGEPPLFLSSSVFFAVKDAVMSARVDADCDKEFSLNSPATPEKIRMACCDQFTNTVSLYMYIIKFYRFPAISLA